jgi:hypothetical protein
VAGWWRGGGAGRAVRGGVIEVEDGEEKETDTDTWRSRWRPRQWRWRAGGPWQMFAAKARVVRVESGSAVLWLCLDVQRVVLLSRLQVFPGIHVAR